MWGRALNWRQRFRPLKYPQCHLAQGSPSPSCAHAGCGNGSVIPWPWVHRMHKREVWSVLFSSCHLLKSMAVFRPHPVKPVGDCRQRSWSAFWTPLVYHTPEHTSNSTQIIVLEKHYDEVVNAFPSIFCCCFCRGRAQSPSWCFKSPMAWWIWPLGFSVARECGWWPVWWLILYWDIFCVPVRENPESSWCLIQLWCVDWINNLVSFTQL